MSLVQVDRLRVELTFSHTDVVDGISFDVSPGEIMGLAGESGAGKSTIGAALLGDARRGSQIAGGSIELEGRQIREMSPPELQHLRGKTIAYVPQDPAAALNPMMSIGRQITELLTTHEPSVSRIERRLRVGGALREVNLPDDDELLRRYPHQLSGGQLQRVTLAMAFILKPRMIIFDEPTTGLDVLTQAHVLRTIKKLCDDHAVAGLYVTHDLAVLAEVADSVMVVYAGRLAEQGPTATVLGEPAHPYTRMLIDAIPDPRSPRVLEGIQGHAPALEDRPRNTCFFAPRCPHALPLCIESDPPTVTVAGRHVARCARVHEISPSRPTAQRPPEPSDHSGDAVLMASRVSAWHGESQILSEVSMEVKAHECVALVGESGSGKTTFARSLIGLHHDQTGEIRFMGESLAPAARDRPRHVRRELQYVFQSPFASLNPFRTIGDSITDVVQHLFGVSRREASSRVIGALEQVSLPTTVRHQYPDALSGGERQRVAIARALSAEPSVLICDEITSALDVSVQASVMELLMRLQSETGMSLLFVTHNLGLVRSVAQRVIVLANGVVVEEGTVDATFEEPKTAYTRSLLESTPAPSGAAL